MTPEGTSPLKKLQEAMLLFNRWEEEGRPSTTEEFLARHPDLEEFLGPLLQEDQGDPPQEGRTIKPEKTLGDFVIIREIGRGGMGVVYEAWQASLARRVALKVLPAHLTLQPKAVTRFRREALSAASLDHPGLIKVFSVGHSGDNHFFAMEFIPGAPLSKMLEGLSLDDWETLRGADLGQAVDRHRHRPTPQRACDSRSSGTSAAGDWSQGYVATTLRLICQVADALDHAHQSGVIHRDVKPSNILVRPDGKAVLTDFGLARETGTLSLTLTGDFVGTPYYVSPEQALGKSRDIDPRSDIFSLGVTLYEMLTLHKPFAGDTSREVLDKIITRDPPDPRRFNPELHTDLAAIILKALEKNPEHRYQTAGELARDLRAFLEFRPVTATHASLATRTIRWTRREPLRAILLLTLAIGLPLLSLLAYYVITNQRPIHWGLQIQALNDLRRGYIMSTYSTALAKERLEKAMGGKNAYIHAALYYAFLVEREDDHQGVLDFLDRHKEGLAGIPVAWEMRNKARRKLGLPLLEVDEPASTDTKKVSADLFIRAMRLTVRTFMTGTDIELPKARDHLLKAIDLSLSRTCIHYCLLVDIAVRMGDRADSQKAKRESQVLARRALKGLQTYWPDSRESCLYQAKVYKDIDPNLGLEVFKKVGPLAETVLGWQVKAELLVKVGREQEAITMLKAAVKRYEDEDPITRGLLLYTLSKIHAEAGRPQAAMEACRRACEVNPKDHRSRNNYYRFLVKTGRIPEAIDRYHRLLQEFPEYVVAKSNLAWAYQEGRQLEKACLWYDRALEQDPHNWRSRLKLANCLRKLRRHQEAEKHYRQLIKEADNPASAYDGMGLLHSRKIEEAEAWFRKAVEANPKHHQALGNLAVTLARQKRYDKALPFMERASRLDPDSYPYHGNLVRLYRDLGMIDKARAELDRWLRNYDADSTWDLNMLAEFHLADYVAPEEQDLDQAAAYASRAVKISKREHPAYLLTLGEAYLRQGRRKDAKQCISEARALYQAGRCPRSWIPSCRRKLADLEDQLEKDSGGQ